MTIEEILMELYRAMGKGPGPRTQERLSMMGVPPGGNYAGGDRSPSVVPFVSANAQYPEGFPTVTDEVRPSRLAGLWDKMHGAQMLAEPFMQASASRSVMGPPGQRGPMTPDKERKQREELAKKLAEDIRAKMFGLEGDIEQAQYQRGAGQRGGSDMDIVNDYRRGRGEINFPGSENWIRWSQESDPNRPEPDSFDTRSPADVLRALAGGGGGMNARDIMTGNRPSDILARQMYEKDKQLQQALAFMASPMPERRKMGAAMLEAYKAGEDIKTAVEDRETAAEDRELGLQAGSREAAIKENEAAIKNAKTQAEADYLRAQASNIGKTEPFENADQRLMVLDLMASKLAASAGLSEKEANKQKWKFIAMLLPKIFPEVAEMGLDISLEE